jgi:hypothetical protein
MNPRQALRRATQRKEAVRIARHGAAAPHVYGFPLAVGRSHVLVRDVDDFDVDGFTVLPLRDVADVRSSERERFLERVLRDEGQLRAVNAPRFALGLGDWSEVFSTLGRAGEIVIVECERPPDDIFCIGVVTGLAPDAVGIHQFDATAVWDPAPTVVPFEQITRVRFDERYIHVFARYVDDDPPDR